MHRVERLKLTHYQCARPRATFRTWGSSPLLQCRVAPPDRQSVERIRRRVNPNAEGQPGLIKVDDLTSDDVFPRTGARRPPVFIEKEF